MKVILLTWMSLLGSVSCFPSPDVPQVRAFKRSSGIGNDRFDAAAASSSLFGRNGFWQTITGRKKISGVLHDVTVSVGASSKGLLESLAGPIESQLSRIASSLSSDVEEQLRHLPRFMTKATSKVVRKVVTLGEEYLGKFGYMSHKRAKSNQLGGIIDLKSFKKSIRVFQQMAGIPMTGQLNKKTVEMMSLPRCGVEDTVGAFNMGVNGNVADSKFISKKERRKINRRRKRGKKGRKGKNTKGARSRSKRFSADNGMWSKTDLKYWLDESKLTTDMSKPKIYDSIARAFEVWSNASSLTFQLVRQSSEADITISFGEAQHGDNYPFDGKGGTLAHAFFPSDGRAHFDDAEKFDYADGSGVNLFIVAAHEFGHSLGLGHSSVQQSLMAPFYKGYVKNFKLHEDDIAGIQQLYGAPKHTADTNAKKRRPSTRPPTRRPTKPTPKRPGAMDVCGKRIVFDATMYHHDDNVMYALKGPFYWKITDYGVAPGYPKKINRFWKGIPSHVGSAVYSKATKRTYFFKGNRMWRYDSNRRLERGFPRSVSTLGMPSHSQAAVQWGGDGLIYLFKDGNFHRFSEYQPYDGRARYTSAPIKRYWTDIPDNPNAAIQWKNGKTYFFKGDDYWRFSGLNARPDKNYPKSVKKMWIGCGSQKASAAKFKQSGRGKGKGKGRKRTSQPRMKLARLQLAPTDASNVH